MTDVEVFAAALALEALARRRKCYARPSEYITDQHGSYWSRVGPPCERPATLFNRTTHDTGHGCAYEDCCLCDGCATHPQFDGNAIVKLLDADVTRRLMKLSGIYGPP